MHLCWHSHQLPTNAAAAWESHSKAREASVDLEESMKIPERLVRRQLACVLVMSLTVPFVAAAIPPQQQPLPGQQSENVSRLKVEPQATEDQPTKTAANTTQPEETYPDSPSATSSQTADKAAQSSAPKANPEKQQSGTPQPVGTAVAPYEKTTGVAASRPSGVVIAPAKQRRARSILIRVGIVAGAAVAIGTVVALSTASHSRP